MARVTPLYLALLFFQLRAQDVAAELGVADIKTGTCTDVLHGPVFFCRYRLRPAAEWHESAEGETIGAAIENLRAALLAHAQHNFSSGN